jgi:hypothetical protein
MIKHNIMNKKIVKLNETNLESFVAKLMKEQEMGGEMNGLDSIEDAETGGIEDAFGDGPTDDSEVVMEFANTLQPVLEEFMTAFKEAYETAKQSLNGEDDEVLTEMCQNLHESIGEFMISTISGEVTDGNEIEDPDGDFE